MAKKVKKADAEIEEIDQAAAERDNQRRELFCRYYAQGEGTFGNATLSYAAAYDYDLGDTDIVDKNGNPLIQKPYRTSYHTCSVNGSSLLRNTEVHERVTKLLNELLKDEIVDAEL